MRRNSQAGPLKQSAQFIRFRIVHLNKLLTTLDFGLGYDRPFTLPTQYYSGTSSLYTDLKQQPRYYISELSTKPAPYALENVFFFLLAFLSS